MERIQAIPSLAALLESHRDEIQCGWVERWQSLPGGHYRERTQDELANWAERGIRALVDSLRSGSTAKLRAHAAEVARVRWELGFNIEEVAAGLLLLKEAALPWLVRSDDVDPERAILAVDTRLRIVIGHFTSKFAEEMSLQHQRVAALQERQRLAHELHDSVSQSLYGVTMYGEAAVRHLDAGNGARASEVLRTLRDTALSALREMRLLIFELRPSLLAQAGLVAALQARLLAVETRGGLLTDLEVDDGLSLPSPVEATLFGIAKESLNNALKHSKGTRVWVRVSQTDSSAILEVRDDGVGFHPNKGQTGGGLGLKGMQERARELGCALLIDSHPGQGTRVRVEVPLNDTPVQDNGMTESKNENREGPDHGRGGG